jgi:hypothetical protein
MTNSQLIRTFMNRVWRAGKVVAVDPASSYVIFGMTAAF